MSAPVSVQNPFWVSDEDVAFRSERFRVRASGQVWDAYTGTIWTLAFDVGGILQASGEYLLVRSPWYSEYLVSSSGQFEVLSSIHGRKDRSGTFHVHAPKKLSMVIFTDRHPPAFVRLPGHSAMAVISPAEPAVIRSHDGATCLRVWADGRRWLGRRAAVPWAPVFMHNDWQSASGPYGVSAHRRVLPGGGLHFTITCPTWDAPVEAVSPQAWADILFVRAGRRCDLLVVGRTVQRFALCPSPRRLAPRVRRLLAAARAALGRGGGPRLREEIVFGLLDDF